MESNDYKKTTEAIAAEQKDLDFITTHLDVKFPSIVSREEELRNLWESVRKHMKKNNLKVPESMKFPEFDDFEKTLKDAVNQLTERHLQSIITKVIKINTVEELQKNILSQKFKESLSLMKFNRLEEVRESVAIFIKKY